jgi:predicted O-methyltransferase YrrM
MEHFYHNLGEDWFTYPQLYKSIVENSNEGSHFVEVGVWKGRSASFMAVEIHNSNKKITFDCVDKWEESSDHIDESNPNTFNTGLQKNDGLYNEYLKNIEPVNHIINSIRTTSVEASKLYSDESLDFVFIDASHDFESVKEDIQHWLPKVKKGGILAGHDYAWCQDVKDAVHTFFSSDKFYESEGCWIYNKN